MRQVNHILVLMKRLHPIQEVKSLFNLLRIYLIYIFADIIMDEEPTVVVTKKRKKIRNRRPTPYNSKENLTSVRRCFSFYYLDLFNFN